MKKIGKLIIVVVLTLAIALGLILSTNSAMNSNVTKFFDDGYVILVNINAESEKVMFNTGETYKVSSAKEIVFNDIQNTKKSIPEDSFFHFDGDLISALQPAVFMNLDEVGENFVTHYQIESGQIVDNSSNKVKIEVGDESYDFDQIILKLNDNRYIILGNDLKAYFSEDDIRECGNYVELHYLDRGIVQIITEDNVWQTAAPDCYIDVNGKTKVFPILEKMINVETGREAFMNSLVVNADDNMHLRDQQQKNVNNIIPHFNVVTEDGKTGEDGETGETSSQGANGDEGTNGKNGTSGDDGIGGSIGSNGKDGISADSDASSRQEIPSITISNWEVTANSISGSAVLQDTYGAVVTPANKGTTLTDDDCVHAFVKEVNGTDEIPVLRYWNTGTETLTDEIIEFNDDDPSTFMLDPDYKLQPDTEYVFVIRGKYIMNSQVITRDFVYRTFYTDSLGLSLDRNEATTSSIIVNVNKMDYSTAKDARIFLLTEEQNKTFTKEIAVNQIASVNPTYHFSSLIEFITDHKESEIKTAEFGTSKSDYTLDPDTKYVARILANFTNEESEVLLNQQLTITTLKRIPTVSGLPTVASNRQNKSFEIYSAAIEDPDKAVYKIVYEVYDNETQSGKKPLLRTIEVGADTFAANNYTSLYIDDKTIKFDHSYFIKEYVIYNDNEKDVTINTNDTKPTGEPLISSTFNIVGTQLPSASFRYVVDNVGNNIGRQYDRIRGWINIYLNGAKINVDEQHPIYVSMVAEGIFDKTLLYTSAESNIDDTQGNYLQLYLDENGLYRDTVYRLSIDAWVDCDEDGNGDSQISYTYRNISNMVVSTAPMPVLKAVWTQPDVPNVGRIARKLTLQTVNPADEEYVKSTLSNIQIGLYSGSYSANIKIKDNEYTDEKTLPGSEDYISTISDKFFEGFDITNRTFGIDDSSLTSESYSIVITAANDYTASSKNSGLDSNYVNTFTIESFDSGVIGTQSAPPKLPAQGSEDSCVTVKEVTLQDVMYSTNIEIDTGLLATFTPETLVGYRLKANYDNYSKLARYVTYYGFEANWFNEFYKGHDRSQDPMLDSSAAKVARLFDVTLEVPTSTNIIPEVIVMFGNHPNGSEYNYFGTTDEGKIIPYFDSSTGLYYFYCGTPLVNNVGGSDRLVQGMDRGFIYCFTYTMKYTSTQTGGLDDLYTYPYDSGEYATWDTIYPYLCMLRSPYMFAPKEKPTFQSYPLLTDKDRLVLYYRYTDPDKLVRQEPSQIVNFLINGTDSNINIADSCADFDSGVESLWNVADFSGVTGVPEQVGNLMEYFVTIGVDGGEYILNYRMKEDFGIENYDGSIIAFKTPWEQNKEDIFVGTGETMNLVIDDLNFIQNNYINVSFNPNGEIKDSHLIGVIITFTPIDDIETAPVEILCEFEQEALGYSAKIPLSKLSTLIGKDLNATAKVVYDTDEFGYLGIELDNYQETSKDPSKGDLGALFSIYNETNSSTGIPKYKGNMSFDSLNTGYYAIQRAYTSLESYYSKSITDENIDVKEGSAINSYFKLGRSDYMSDAGSLVRRYSTKHMAIPSVSRYFTYQYTDRGLKYSETYYGNPYVLLPKIVGSVFIRQESISTIASPTDKVINIGSIVPTSYKPSSSADTESVTVSTLNISGADQITEDPNDGKRYVYENFYQYFDTVDVTQEDGSIVSTKVQDYVYIPIVKYQSISTGEIYNIPLNKIRVENPVDGSIEYRPNTNVAIKLDDNNRYYMTIADPAVEPNPIISELRTEVYSIDGTSKQGKTRNINVYGLDADCKYQFTYFVDLRDREGEVIRVPLINSESKFAEQLYTEFQTDRNVQITGLTMKYSDTDIYSDKVFTANFGISQAHNIRIRYNVYDIDGIDIILTHQQLIDQGIISEEISTSLNKNMSKTFNLKPGTSGLIPGVTYTLGVQIYSASSGGPISEEEKTSFSLPLSYYPSGNISIVPTTVTDIELGRNLFGYNFRFTALADDDSYVMGPNFGEYVVRIYNDKNQLVTDSSREYDHDGDIDNITVINEDTGEVTSLAEIYSTAYVSNEPTPNYSIVGLKPNTKYKFVVYAGVDQDYNGKVDTIQGKTGFADVEGMSVGSVINYKKAETDEYTWFDKPDDSSLRSMYSLVEKTKTTPNTNGISIGSVNAHVSQYNSSQAQLTYYDTSGIDKIDRIVVSIVHSSGYPCLSAINGEIKFTGEGKVDINTYYKEDKLNGSWTLSIPVNLFAATKTGIYDMNVYHYIGNELIYSFEGKMSR